MHKSICAGVLCSMGQLDVLTNGELVLINKLYALCMVTAMTDDSTCTERKRARERNRGKEDD